MHAPCKLSTRSCMPCSLFPLPLCWSLRSRAEFSGNALKPPFPLVLPAMASRALAAAAQGEIRLNLGATPDLRCRASATADEPQAARFLPKHNIPLLFASMWLIAQNLEWPLNGKNNGGREAIKNIFTTETKPSPWLPQASSASARGPNPLERQATPGRARQTNQSPTDKWEANGTTVASANCDIIALLLHHL